MKCFLSATVLSLASSMVPSLKKDCSFLSKCEEYDDLKKAVDAYKAKKK